LSFLYLKKNLGPHTARASELAPAETLFFAQLPDLARTRDRWLKTALADLWREPEMEAFMEKPLAKMAHDSTWQARLDHLVRLRPREMFIAVTSIDGPTPRFVVGLCFSGSKSQVEALLAEPRAALKKAWPAGKADLINYGTSEIEIFSEKENVMAGGFRGDWYFAANNLELLQHTLDRYDQKRAGGNAGNPGGTLADSPLFAAAVAKLSAEHDGLLFAQLGTVMDRVTGLLAASGQKFDALQLAALKKTQAIAASTKIDGKQFRDTVFLLSPGSKPEHALQRHSLALTSPGTVLYYAAGLPANIELPESLFSMGALWLPALESMQKRLAEKGLVLADLGKAFGPEFGTVVDWPQTTSQPSLVLAFDVRDPVRAKAFTELLTTGEAAWEKSEQDGAVIYTAPESETLPLITPSIALTDGFFLVGLSEESVGPALERFKVGVPAINTTPKYEGAARSVGTPTGSFGYVDLAGLCERAYERIFRPFAVMSMTFAPEAGEYIDAGKLPSTATIIKHFGPMVLSQSSSEQGMLFESAGTLTFAQVLVGGAAGAIAAALPNLSTLTGEGGINADTLLQLKRSVPIVPADSIEEPKEAPAQGDDPKVAP
ncbi:MAG: hypothetical protein JWL90_4135, partial [Chthoniobacteraceae bacterium]|nr:hypothetical protein [Chthoniobacteraceae bacterium]